MHALSLSTNAYPSGHLDRRNSPVKIVQLATVRPGSRVGSSGVGYPSSKFQANESGVN